MRGVSAVKNMLTTFQRMDIFQGGGSGRLALAEYMNQHVYPLLRRAHADDVRDALCEAAAEQTYLLGWMAYDNGEHGTAQRYLIQSLRLADESKNVALGAHVLAGMADQATLLGDPGEGRRLAQAGRHGLMKATSPACLADAASYLQRRDLDLAYAAGLRTLALTKQVKSSRAVDAVADLQKRMRPFGRNRLVADFNDRARDLVTAA